MDQHNKEYWMAWNLTKLWKPVFDFWADLISSPTDIFDCFCELDDFRGIPGLRYSHRFWYVLEFFWSIESIWLMLSTLETDIGAATRVQKMKNYHRIPIGVVYLLSTLEDSSSLFAMRSIWNECGAHFLTLLLVFEDKRQTAYSCAWLGMDDFKMMFTAFSGWRLKCIRQVLGCCCLFEKFWIFFVVSRFAENAHFRWWT